MRVKMWEFAVLASLLLIVFLFTPYKLGIVKIGESEYTTIIADNLLSQAQGYMLKPFSLPMVFVFPEEQKVGIWMFLTFFPLYVHYYNGKGELVKVVKLKPLSLTPVVEKAKYVIEYDKPIKGNLKKIEEKQLIFAFQLFFLSD